jgi:indolepyruvate ferredoxin oxidoreductase beta subunit
MKKDIILAGVGGQGILSIAAAIGYAAIESGLQLKQSEVHGMSQRGGEVQSHLRISDSEIASDLIPFGGADMIISVEPMEGLRYLPYLAYNGWLITNLEPYVNIPNYPDIELIKSEISSVANHISLNADEIAKELKSVKSSNIVMLGAASPFLEIEYKKLEDAIKFIFKKKGDAIININLSALKAGKDFAEAFSHTNST